MPEQGRLIVTRERSSKLQTNQPTYSPIFNPSDIADDIEESVFNVCATQGQDISVRTLNSSDLDWLIDIPEGPLQYQEISKQFINKLAM
jgi:hypothetical protein